MKLKIPTFRSIIAEPDRHFHMALLLLLYAFMNVATKLTIGDRIALNPYYKLFITVAFIFAVLFICGTFVQYIENKNAKEVYKKYHIQVIT